MEHHRGGTSNSPVFSSDGTVFAGTKSLGVFVSSDGGSTWHQIGGMAGNMIRSLGVSPEFASDDRLFAGAWDGLYCS